MRIAGTAHEVEGTGTVLYDDNECRLLVLNDVAAAAWYLIDGERSVGAIAQSIVEATKADPAHVRKDLDTFLDQLSGFGLVK